MTQMTFMTYLQQTSLESYHKFNEVNIDNLINDLDIKSNIVVEKAKEKREFYNIPCAFDIETSSYYIDGEKNASMYVWQFGIAGYCIVGRTWIQFKILLSKLSKALELSEHRRLVVYVHNLQYEFQWMRKWLNWESVFAIGPRGVAYANCDLGIEFKCSYILSGKALSKVGDDLMKYKVSKMVGDLDYSLMRHSKTELTEKEIGYIINDIKVVMAYIQEMIEQDGDITRILMTKTGYVRKYCKDACYYGGETSHKKAGKQYREYNSLIHSLTIDGIQEYQMLKRAFMGGFTHGNPYYIDRVMENVSSFDFTSSYPFTMVAFAQFPMSSSEIVKPRNEKEFRKNLKYYCCLFDIEFIGLESKEYYESYIPSSKCMELTTPIISNGRVVSAERLVMTITEQDFAIIEQVYTWERIRLGKFRRYRKGYLPTELVKSILKLYGDKTQLKGVPEREADYNISKSLLNSTYGCFVTDMCQETQTYIDDEWTMEAPDFGELIKEYNKKFQRFNYYPWGVWVTAISRRNLWTGILEFKNDYIYSDTDSVKVLNKDNHMEYINKYNDNCIKLLKRSMKYHSLDEDFIIPSTIKGEKKPLGVWDYEGTYDKFKTLGAKRYMIFKDGKYNITVSGLNKKVTVPYLISKYKDPFKAFTSDLYIPSEHTGKSTHTYIDYETESILYDYKGSPCKMYEKSSIHMEPAEYSLSISKAFLNYINGLREVKA